MSHANPQERTLIQGAVILSQDTAVGDFTAGDILIEGERILAVGAALHAPDARRIAAHGMLALPGLVDAHRHAWQGALRLLMPNAATLDEYVDAVHFALARHYRPRDIHLGCYLSAVSCLDAGITTIIDPCHNARSPEHTDAAIDAYLEAGLRVLHMPGKPHAGVWARHWPRDMERLKARRFATADQLLTLGMYAQPDARNWALARRLELPILSEMLGVMAPMLAGWQKVCPLGPDNILHHCTGMPDEAWRLLRAAGVRVSVAARADAQYALEGGVSAYQAALDHGFLPGLGTEMETAYGGDMFSEMRVTFFMQRAMAQAARHRGEAHAPAPVSVQRMLRSATIDGARCAGLEGRTGSLTPGKQADIILLNGADVNLMGANSAAGAVVHAAGRGNVDTVMVAGRLRKRGGLLLEVDLARLRADVEESQRHLFQAGGYRHDRLREGFPETPPARGRAPT